MNTSYLEDLFQKETSRALEEHPEESAQHERIFQAKENFRKMEEIHTRLGRKHRCPKANFESHGEGNPCVDTLVFLPINYWSGRGYLVQGITTEGWGWFGWSDITMQVAQWVREPFAGVRGCWSLTPLPWLMLAKDFDRINTHPTTSAENIVRAILERS